MLLIIISILAIGLLLLILEIFFIPGTTLIGILGIGFILAGVALTYNSFGSEAGLAVLIGSSTLSVSGLIYALRTKSWTRFSLKTAITSKVNEGSTSRIQLHDLGMTVSTLRPVGKARFNEVEFEVKTLGTYVAENVPIKVIEVHPNQIIVEPTN